MSGGAARWLLIGNSRWHWAEDTGSARRYWSVPSGGSLRPAPDRWAAVGPRPSGLDPGAELHLAQVPLQGLPPWLGIDRALAGYEAWHSSGSAVLVADAGTALSLTWVDGRGCFQGGRLMAGAALQLQALHQCTAALPAPVTGSLNAGAEAWPQPTQEAMVCGVLQGMAGALQRAARQLLAAEPGLTLWLTGGDAPSLAPLLEQHDDDSGRTWRLAPGLCLDGLARVSKFS